MHTQVFSILIKKKVHIVLAVSKNISLILYQFKNHLGSLFINKASICSWYFFMMVFLLQFQKSSFYIFSHMPQLIWSTVTEEHIQVDKGW